MHRFRRHAICAGVVVISLFTMRAQCIHAASETEHEPAVVGDLIRSLGFLVPAEPTFEDWNRLRTEINKRQLAVERELARLRSKRADLPSVEGLDRQIGSVTRQIGRLRKQEAEKKPQTSPETAEGPVPEQLGAEEDTGARTAPDTQSSTPVTPAPAQEELNRIRSLGYLGYLGYTHVSTYVSTAEQIAQLEENVENLEAQKRETVKLDERIDQKEQELLDLNRIASMVDSRLASILDVEAYTHKFRTRVSYAFCLLVGAVIIGFFGVVYRKQDMAATFLSGDKGIQFITLFLLVISIALFGFMGVLEGKELSALLGGLSGYILGRVSN